MTDPEITAEAVTMNAPAVCAAAGITYRQLDYWTKRGLIPLPDQHPGSGSARSYPPDAVRVAVIMAALIRAGFTLKAAHRIATHRAVAR